MVDVVGASADHGDVVLAPDACERRPPARQVAELRQEPVPPDEREDRSVRIAHGIDADGKHDDPGPLPAQPPQRRIEVSSGDRTDVGTVRVEKCQ